MITVIAATCRPDSFTEAIASIYCDDLKSLGVDSLLLKLSSLPHDFIFAGSKADVQSEVNRIAKEFIEPADKMIWVLPEYNGSFPGVAKAFIDVLDPKLFREKKAGLIGIASGRAGNLRGTDQFSMILHYLKMHVHYSKPKLSGIENLMDDTFKIVDETTRRVLREHAGVMVGF